MLKFPPVTTESDLDAFLAAIFSILLNLAEICGFKICCNPLLRTADIFYHCFENCVFNVED